MIAIYIYEVDDQLRKRIGQEVTSYISENPQRTLSMEIALSSSDMLTLLRSINTKKGLYIIGTGDNITDSIFLGKEIRSLDSRGYIVYITACKDLVLCAFKHHIEVMDYIFKSQNLTQDLPPAIKRCLDTIAKRTEDEYRSKLDFIYHSGNK